MSTLADFLDERHDRVVETYLELVFSRVARYQQYQPETFPANTRRLVRLLPQALDDPKDEAVQEYVTELVQQRLPAGFLLTDILEAMFLYDDVIQPMIVDEVEDVEERFRLAADLQNAVQIVALLFAQAYVDLQLEVLEKQRQATLELSTPVIKVWDGILALPLIGTINSYRARQIMEGLLSTVTAEQASIVLLDITGVPVVDTNVADHLIKTIRAAELLGAECLLVGIKPDLAQTLVGLGINLEDITAAADLRRELDIAFARLGLRVIASDE